MAVRPALTRCALHAVLEHARAGYPSEVCGVLTGPRGQGCADRAFPVRNTLRAADAFALDDAEHLRVLIAEETCGRQERIIYHSHVDAPARFSPADVEGALVDGAPRFPGVDHLVVATHAGAVSAARLYRWDGARFVGLKLDVREMTTGDDP